MEEIHMWNDRVSRSWRRRSSNVDGYPFFVTKGRREKREGVVRDKVRMPGGEKMVAAMYEMEPRPRFVWGVWRSKTKEEAPRQEMGGLTHFLNKPKTTY